MASYKARVLCGAPVLDTSADYYALSRESLERQELWPDVSLELHDIKDDGASGEAYANGTHQWSEDRFDRIAFIKQQLFQKAVEEGYSHFFLVDSDLVLEPRTLKSLLAAKQEITSAVFWTRWNAEDPASLGPNVWLSGSYSQDGMGLSRGEFWRGLIKRRLTKIIGGGACCLFSTAALKRGLSYHPRVRIHGAMGAGEDRTLQISAQRLRLQQAADPWPDIFHLYHPQQREQAFLEEVREWMLLPQQRRISYGDLIHFTIEPLSKEDLRNSYSIRGRMGELDLVPSLEALLLEMEVGEERIESLSFPFYWPQDAGSALIARVHLIDCKPYGFPPIAADTLIKELP
jgi:hypothetical protein